MIEYIQTPISSVVEDLGSRRLVYGDFNADDELLVLLHSYYPEDVPRRVIRESLDRRADSTISKSLQRLWEKKLLHKREGAYRLTQEGHRRATGLLQSHGV